MIIRINGVDADIKLETEKTVGEVLAALDTWLSGSGYRFSGMSIDGETANAGSMESFFNRNIDTIHTLDLNVSSILELLAECLLNTMESIDTYESAAFEEKGLFFEQWKESPGACLLAEQIPELYNWTVQAFSGEGSGTRALRTIIEGRLCELENPENEMNKAGPLVADICTRLGELPLDIQTGKDARAAETISLFSGIAEKVFRIYNILKADGFPVDEITVEDKPIAGYISEFSTALQELLAAYKQNDTVMVGDLAEYEIAPRLRSLHTAIINGMMVKQ